MAKSQKRLTTPDAGKDMEQQEVLFTAASATKWNSHFGSHFGSFLQN
jgi:hypothetical protein